MPYWDHLGLRCLSILVQVMDCCLSALSHYLNQWWLFVNLIWINFNEIWTKIWQFSFKKKCIWKCLLFCSQINMLKTVLCLWIVTQFIVMILSNGLLPVQFQVINLTKDDNSIAHQRIKFNQNFIEILIICFENVCHDHPSLFSFELVTLPEISFAYPIYIILFLCPI